MCVRACVRVCVCACLHVNVDLYLYTCIPFQINGKDISWQHLVRVYEANRGRQTDTPGLCLLHKVKAVHIFLISFSRMRVDLAAQVRVRFL